MNDLDPTRAALLALDLQNYGVQPPPRRHRVLVVHVGVAWRPGSPEMNMTAPLFARAPDRSVEGTRGAEFYEPVAPVPGGWSSTNGG
jgi:hypothetical protein